MKRLFSGLLSVIALCLTLCACTFGPTPAPAPTAAPSATPATAPTVEPTALPIAVDAVAPVSASDAPFFQTIPPTGGTQVIQIAADQEAAVSIASTDAAVPLAAWQNAGWQTGRELDSTEAVPDDCLLHARYGITHQLYARCPGGSSFTVPVDGADFVYVVLFDQSHTVKQAFQTGKLYNPDTTGLIP